MGVDFGSNSFYQMPNMFGTSLESTTGSSTTVDADLKEYKTLLEKQTKGKLSTVEQSRLRELQSTLSKAGKLNNDGSVKTKRNSDKLKSNAKKMSWADVASIWGCSSGLAAGGAARVVQSTATRAISQQGGMMSKNGSVFGQRRV